MRIIRALGDYFSDLFDGNPTTWLFTLIFLAIAAALCLFWWYTARKLRQEDEERKRQSKQRPGPGVDFVNHLQIPSGAIQSLWIKIETEEGKARYRGKSLISGNTNQKRRTTPGK